MSMCHLCELCAKYKKLDCFDVRHGVFVKYVIDWGREDPLEICNHFELKEAVE